MTREDAITRANAWVQAHFAVVPPVGFVIRFDRALFTRFQLENGIDPAEADLQGLFGKWMISYHCSWDTDALGLPLTLHVLVDDSTGIAERLPFDDGESTQP